MTDRRASAPVPFLQEGLEARSYRWEVRRSVWRARPTDMPGNRPVNAFTRSSTFAGCPAGSLHSLDRIAGGIGWNSFLTNVTTVANGGTRAALPLQRLMQDITKGVVF